MKVFFLTNIPSKYRVDFFNEIGKSCELTVLFERRSLAFRNEKFINNNFINFKGIFLDAFKFSSDNTITFKARKHIKKNNYDIIILGNYHTLTAMITCKYLIRKKIPYALSIDGIFKKENEKRLKFNLKYKMFSNTYFFLTTGHYSINVIEYYGGKKEHCYLYPFTSVMESYLEKVSAAEKIKLKHNFNILHEKSYLYVGQMIDRKGLDILLEAFPNDYKFKLFLIGGSLNEKYQKIIERRSLANIEVIEFLDSNKLEAYYKAVDFLILPTNEDQWGLVINEAMGKGLPCITTDRCLAAFEMIENKKSGYTITNNNIKELKDVIVATSQLTEEQYNQLSNNAILVAEMFTLEKMSKRHIEIFQEVITSYEKNS